MNPSSVPCDLCGLPTRYKTFKWTSGRREFCFCCMGCRQVFVLLAEADDDADPARFREAPLFAKCLEMGIIPRTAADLEDDPQSRGRQPAQPVGPAAPDGLLSVHLHVDGMWCPACAWVIEHALLKHAGVVRSSCNFSTDRVRCEYNPVQTSPEQIKRVITDLGYTAGVPEEDGIDLEARKNFIRFAISAFLTANVMMLSFALYSGFFTSLTPETVHSLSWPIFVLAGIVLFYGGPQIYRRAWAGIVRAAPGMEALITIGAFTAFFYSAYNFFAGSIHLYFDTACMLITLTLLGKTIERKAKSAVQQDLGNFFSLRPTKVKLVSAEFPAGRYTAAGAIRTGDVFRVEESEIVPADGLVIEGTGTLDESSLTGETLPVRKAPGNRVRSGTHLTEGLITVRAEAVGEASTLGQMIAIMEKTLGGKTPLEGKTDRILRFFVPAVVLLAAATGLVCFMSCRSTEAAVIRAVTVMVISCPCALGIAIPMARVAGIAVAGKKGILVRDFSAFEQARRSDTIVFDKTGTLTDGQWALLDTVAVAPFDPDRALSLAAALEKDSDHYIAAEILKTAEQKGAVPADLHNVQIFENGISGMLGSETVKIGSRSFIGRDAEHFLTLADVGSKHATLQSTVFMSCNDRLCAVFVFGDTLRPTAPATVKRLRDQGYRLALVSGDGEKTTRAVGDELGIQDAFGGRLPRDKAFLVRDLQQNGRVVTMVGDGINDAPALVQSDMAVAVHSGSRLGKEAADITLMQGDPGQLPDFLIFAKLVNRKIHQNLLFSLFYNTVSIPVAMSGLLTPLVAVCAMLLSSLSVIGNTLLLKQKSP